MKLKTRFSLVTTIMNGVLLLCGIAGTVGVSFLWPMVDDLFATAGDTMGGTSSNGWDILGGLFLGMIAVVGAAMIFALIGLCLLLVFFLIPTIVVGIVSLVHHKQGEYTQYRADSIVKIIMNSFVTLGLLSGSTALPLLVIAALISMTVIGLSIANLCIHP